MSEYLLTDLPRYVKTTPRENFANSVVKDGAVLLFSEDGETLVAKHPDGSFTEIGSGSGGGSTEFYKCVSVDTEAKTWSGYKAEWGDNGYTFSDELTEGLVYSGMTPQVDSIYDSEAFVRVAQLYMVSSGSQPFFYAPLTEDWTKEIDPGFGDVADMTNATFASVDNIPCVQLESGRFGWEVGGYIPTGEHAISFSFGLRATGSQMSKKALMFYGLTDNTDRGLGIQISTGNSIQMAADESGRTVGNAVTLEQDRWYHILVTYAVGGDWSLYVNGVLSASGNRPVTLPDTGYGFYFGNATGVSSSYRNINACITRARIYDYAISDPDEIAWLMQEIGVS